MKIVLNYVSTSWDLAKIDGSDEWYYPLKTTSILPVGTMAWIWDSTTEQVRTFEITQAIYQVDDDLLCLLVVPEDGHDMFEEGFKEYIRKHWISETAMDRFDWESFSASP